MAESGHLAGRPSTSVWSSRSRRRSVSTFVVVAVEGPVAAGALLVGVVALLGAAFSRQPGVLLLVPAGILAVLANVCLAEDVTRRWTGLVPVRWWEAVLGSAGAALAALVVCGEVLAGPAV